MAKTSRKKPVRVAASSIYAMFDKGVKVDKIASTLNISSNSVYRFLRRRKVLGNKKPNLAIPLGKKVSSKTDDVAPVVSISIQFTSKFSPVEIKLVNQVGRAAGTLKICEGGMEYRKPNGKLSAEKLLTWQLLERIMQLGIG